MKALSPRTTVLAAAAILALGATGLATAGSGLITGAGIKDGSITARDLSPSLRAQIARPGPRGVQGIQGFSGAPGLTGTSGLNGATGATGANGVAGAFDPTKIVYVTGPSVSVPPGAVQNAMAICPLGATAISGGYFASITNPGALVLGHTSVDLIVNNDSNISVDVNAYVVCSF